MFIKTDCRPLAQSVDTHTENNIIFFNETSFVKLQKQDQQKTLPQNKHGIWHENG